MKKSLPPNHKWLETADGTQTLFSEVFQEGCHSTSGAKKETLLHYIEGCQIQERLLSQDQLVILEVGFGLGIGFLTTLEVLESSSRPWTFLSLELDEELLEWFRLEHLEHPFLKLLEWNMIGEVKVLTAKNSMTELTILCGDARKTLPKFVEATGIKWNAIYQDAFSPRKNPTLWTKEWFELLKANSLPKTYLSTYSASSSIRKSLLEAGWSLHKGEKFGPKRTSTRASLSGISDPEILEQLNRSPVLALRDDNIQTFLTK
jgi:chorismate dehydratase